MDRDSCKQTPAYVTSVNTRRGGYDGCLCKVEVCGHCFRVIFTRVVCHLGKLVHSDGDLLKRLFQQQSESK